jgi:hypothetical protein
VRQIRGLTRSVLIPIIIQHHIPHQITINITTKSGNISRINIEPGTKGPRFVMSIAVTTAGVTTYEFFSTPLHSQRSVEINAQQLRSAFPELALSLNPFQTLLENRSKFIGKAVHFTVSPQLNDDGTPKMNTKVTPHTPYTNLRLEPDMRDLTPDEAAKLLAAPVAAGIAANADAPDDDIQM